MMDLEPKILDARRKKDETEGREGAVTRLPIIERALKRSIARFIENLPKSFEAAGEVHNSAHHAELAGTEAGRAFVNRIVETTYHPSQNLPLQYYYRSLTNELKELWKRHRESLLNLHDPTLIEEEAELITKRIIGKSEDKLIDFNDVAIRSNATLPEAEITRIQNTLVERLSGLLVRMQKESGWSPHEGIPRLFELIPHEKLENELRQVMGGVRVDPSKERIDETWETVLEAKTLLLNNITREHYVWVDFDGAKRAEGHTYTKYAALVYEDILRNLEDVSGKELIEINSLYDRFIENTSFNHAISAALKEPEKINPNVRSLLERTLTILKANRYERLDELAGKLNTIKQRNIERGKNDLVYLSECVKFMPRLDHKMIEAAITAQRDPTELRDQQKAQYAILRNILSQVLEINQLARERHLSTEETTSSGAGNNEQSVIPQIMIAECRGWEDIRALKAALDLARDLKYEDRPGDYSTQISLVPLFESEKTVAPKSIDEYLVHMWNYYDGKYKDGADQFRQNINEVFIAGSDLSKEIGQTSALVKAWEALAAIVEFNKQYKTDIRLKIGTGEAPFRQGGLWDPEGFLPMVRGKIIDHRPPSDESIRTKEEQAVQEQTHFLEETIGSNWKTILLRKPRGFNRLFKLFQVNSFTNQSFSKEQTLVNIDTDRLRRMRREAETTHENNMHMLAAGEFKAIPKALREAASHEQAFYQTIFGKEGGEKTMFGRLLQFCAKNLPAPELRDRGLGRDSSTRGDEVFLRNLAEPRIDARAISANTVSGYLFPLYLIGKGSMLAAAHEKGQLHEVMQNGQVDVKELLRQMKLYEQIAPEIFEMLRTHGMTEDAGELEKEWGKLLERRVDIQEEMWRQESPEEPEKFDFMSLTADQRKQLAECFVPGMRELLDDNFASDRTALFKKNFERHKNIVEAAMTYVQTGYEWMEASSDSNRKTAFENAKTMKNAITRKEYGTFLANLVTCYSPGM